MTFQPQPAQVIEKARTLWSSGSTIADIASLLAQEGVKSMKTGVPCTPSMVYNWINKPVVGGDTEGGKKKRKYRSKKPAPKEALAPPAPAATPAPAAAPSVTIPLFEHRENANMQLLALVVTDFAAVKGIRYPEKLKMIRALIDSLEVQK